MLSGSSLARMGPRKVPEADAVAEYPDQEPPLHCVGVFAFIFGELGKCIFVFFDGIPFFKSWWEKTVTLTMEDK